MMNDSNAIRKEEIGNTLIWYLHYTWSAIMLFESGFELVNMLETMEKKFKKLRKKYSRYTNREEKMKSCKLHNYSPNKERYKYLQ